MNYIKVTIGEDDDDLFEAITEESLSTVEPAILKQIDFDYLKAYYGLNTIPATLEELEKFYEDQTISFFVYFYNIDQI
jgi:hypothetical protein